MQLLRTVVAVACLCVFTSSVAINERGAKKLAKKSDCFKCHAIDKKKDGPSLVEISKKYKDKVEAKEVTKEQVAEALYTHITTNPTVEVDGKKEKHKSIESDDEAAIRNIVEWIISR